MCGRNIDTNGKINDYGHIVIGEPQIYEHLSNLNSEDIVISVLHHPFSWLQEFDRDRVEERLKKESNFILYGHQHKSKVDVVQGTTGNC